VSAGIDEDDRAQCQFRPNPASHGHFRRQNALQQWDSVLEAPLVAEQQKAFVAALAAKYGRRLRRFLFTRTRNAADVPDLAQEVFLRLLRADQHAVIHSPEAYLFTVASHVAHQHTLRAASVPSAVDITELLADLQLTSPDDPAEKAETREKLQDLQRALDQLPPKLSTALLLNRFAGFSIEEVAEQLGIARSTTKKYLAQALLHCRSAREKSK
jgi:RNA polymerase sigma-70 factor (ECF subfamily)